jgi:hypothetical protein
MNPSTLVPISEYQNQVIFENAIVYDQRIEIGTVPITSMSQLIRKSLTEATNAFEEMTKVLQKRNQVIWNQRN